MSCPTGNSTTICAQIGGTGIAPFAVPENVQATLAKYRGAELAAESDEQELVIRAVDEDTCRKAAKRVKTLYPESFAALWQNSDDTYSVILTRERAIQKIAAYLRTLHHEKLYMLWDRDILFSIDGDETQFTINPAKERLIQQVRDHVDLMSIHNHPDHSLPPSDEDIANGMINRETTSYVTTPDGMYRINYPDKVKGPAITRFRRAWAQHHADVFAAQFPQYKETVWKDQAWNKHNTDPSWIKRLSDLRAEVIARTSQETGLFTVDFTPCS